MLLDNAEEFQSKMYKDFVNVQCDHCGRNYKITKKNLLQKKYMLNEGRVSRGKLKNDLELLQSIKDFCCVQCLRTNTLDTYETKTCKHCGKEFEARKSENRKFCSQSCAGTFNNLNKEYGFRRSKLEIWFEKVISECFDIECRFNRKDAINSELDIYFPSIKLAFELNGLFHYEPIFGEDNLDKVKNNDERKFQACIENGIELCIIDTSGQKRFTPESSIKYLEIILNLLKAKGIEPNKNPKEYGLSYTVGNENIVKKTKPLSREINCKSCGKKFLMKRLGAQFCSRKCRNHYYYKYPKKLIILERDGELKSVKPQDVPKYRSWGWVKKDP